MSTNSIAPRRPVILIVLAAIASGVLTIAGGAFLYRNTRALTAAAGWISHTHDVQIEVQKALIVTERIESIGSIYAVNNDHDQADAARLNLIRLNTEVANLKELVVDNPNQARRVAQLEECSANLAGQLNHDTFDGTVLRNEALECHQTLQLMFNEEQQLLEKRNEVSRNRTQFQVATEAITALVSLLVFGILYALLFRDAVKRARIARESVGVNSRLKESVVALEARASEARLISAARHELQLCTNIDQIHRSVASQIRSLLPGTNGTLYVVNYSKNLMEAVSHWSSNGDAALATDVVAPDSCCGLRGGQLRWRRPGNSELDCEHFQEAKPERYLCVPLIAHSETLGVLNIECPTEQPLATIEERIESLQQFVQLIAMSLAGLQLRTKLENQSMRDPLTSLFNRHFMQVAFDRELLRAARRKNNLAVFMMDVDHVKKFNDHYGHAAGDAALVEVAKVFRNEVRSEDIVCRYGGEEFAIILPEINAEAAYERAERIRRAVSVLRIPLETAGSAEVTVSIGVALYPAEGETSETLLRAADKALYAAKHAGRNRVVLA
jgi:diguanylate cyclase (GGDEF)-like protein